MTAERYALAELVACRTSWDRGENIATDSRWQAAWAAARAALAAQPAPSVPREPQDYDALVEQLRQLPESIRAGREMGYATCSHAADAIAALLDECEKLRADAERMRKELERCQQNR